MVRKIAPADPEREALIDERFDLRIKKQLLEEMESPDVEQLQKINARLSVLDALIHARRRPHF